VQARGISSEMKCRAARQERAPRNFSNSRSAVPASRMKASFARYVFRVPSSTLMKSRRCLPLVRSTPIWKLEAALKCRTCRTPRYSSPARMIKLTEERELSPYVWVHSDEEGETAGASRPGRFCLGSSL
jgi:hypothetical protein